MSDAIERLQDTATAKLGPLPAWGWGLIVAGVALVAYFLSQRSGLIGSGTTATKTATLVGSSTDPTTVDGLGTSDSTGSTTDTTSGTGLNTAYTSSNQSWLARAMSQVSAEFGASPSDVYTALYNALQGETITSTQKKYWDRALSDLGVPPEGTQGVSTVTDPVIGANTGTPSVGNTTVDSGNTDDSAGTVTTNPTPAPAGKVFTNIRRIAGTNDLYGLLNGQWQSITGDDWRRSGSPDAGEWSDAERPARYVRVRNTYDVYKWNSGTGWSGPLSHDQYVAEGAPAAQEVASAPI